MRKFFVNTFKIIFFTITFFATASISIDTFPHLKDLLNGPDKRREEINSKNIYELMTDQNILGYDIRDLKLKEYYTHNPESFIYEDSNFVFELRLDQNKFFQYPRTDYYHYSLISHSKIDGMANIGWQTAGIYLHESPAESFKSTVSAIKADYRKFPELGNKEVYVVTVSDNDDDYLYVVYPKRVTYEEDHEKAVNIDYVLFDEYNEHGFKEGVNVMFNDYEFMEKENAIRLFFNNDYISEKSILLTFDKDKEGKVLYSTKKE